MNLAKSREYFDPSDVKSVCHIIGCGSVGSTVAENLARLGVTKIYLYDFDKVEPHNLANQMFADDQVGMDKVEAVASIITSINPEAKTSIKLFPKGYTNQKLNGFVFLCVDNIDLRRKICEDNKMNQMIKAVFDFRTRLEDAQHYAANWSDIKEVNNLINTMQFTHEEAAAQTPVSACNVELSVAPTLRTICAFGVSNFMNFVKNGELKKMILVDPFRFTLDAI